MPHLPTWGERSALMCLMNPSIGCSGAERPDDVLVTLGEALPRHREECVLSNICDGQRWSVEQPDQRELARCKDYRFGPAARRCLLSTGLLWPCERAGRACSNKAPSRLRGIPDKLRVPPLTRGGQWALFAFLLESCEVVGGGGSWNPMPHAGAPCSVGITRSPDTGQWCACEPLKVQRRHYLTQSRVNQGESGGIWGETDLMCGISPCGRR